MRRNVWTAVCLGALACNGGDSPGESSFGMFRPPAPFSTIGVSESATSDAGSTTDDSSQSSAGTLPLLETSTDAASSTSTDTGAPPDLSPPGPTGCLGKIDFLFVISNSPTMAPMQSKLVAAFPGFIDTIQSYFSDFDVHIMVVETDDFFYVDDCSLCQEDCNKQGPPPQCGAAVHPCDEVMGAGVTYPAGIYATNRRCDLVGGNRYITSAEPDLHTAFQCIAQVGSNGGTLHNSGDAMISAVSDALNGPSGCNEGFVRNDALLVVTLIADTPDQASIQPTDFWSNALLKAKHGDPDAIMVLALSTDIDQPIHLCLPDKGQVGYDHPFRELTELLPHAMFESICVDSYVPFFTSAVASIVERCEQMIPK